MRQIEEVEQSLVDYRGMPLLQCGRYIFDGELRIRPADQSTAKVKCVHIFHYNWPIYIIIVIIFILSL